MKNSLRLSALALLLVASLVTQAQLRKIPAEVTDAFSAKYPNAAKVEWRDKLSGFTASFQEDSISYLASFNNKGEWESTEQSIDEEDLPEAVQQGFDKSKYTEWEIAEVSKIQLPENQIQYKVLIEKGDLKKRNLYFNEEGRLLKDKITL